MTSEEALRALGEMIDVNGPKKQENDHYFELAGKILDKEVPFEQKNPATKQLWPKK